MRASSNGWSCDLAGAADTIVARATPAGRGALAMIRVSGPLCADVAAAVCPLLEVSRAGRAQLVNLRSADGEVVEQGVVLPYRAPRSYTGEDMLEIMIHGSPWLVATLIDACVAVGAREAFPGEFTRRAVFNGKLDLLQAEAVHDLVSAETAWQARNARRQLDGKLSERVREIRGLLVELLADVEAAVDFVEHGLELDVADWEEKRRLVGDRVRGLLATATAGERVRDGARVVILGEPNAGKSTLFNTLVRSDRAIVTARPGTTRDMLEADVEIAGVPVTLIDTAGVRDSGNEVEIEGVRRALEAVADAAAVVLLWPADGQRAPTVRDDVPTVRVRSKADLLAGPVRGDAWLRVSAKTGEGLAELEEMLRELVGGGTLEADGEVAIARRHRAGLEVARRELEECCLDTPELAAEHLRWALRAVAELCGEVTDEDVLDRVFSAFCVGK